MLRRRSRARPEARLHVPTAGTVVALEVVEMDRVWRSRVEDQNAAELVVLAPGGQMVEAVMPEPGTAVTIGWPSTIGYLEAEGTLSRTEFGDVATWTVQIRTSELSQRRSAYRLEANLPVAFEVEELGGLSATTRNLSEGGLAIELPNRYELANGERVGVTVELPDGNVDGRGRIVRSAPMVPDGLEVVVAFEGLADEDAERLRQYVFEEQLTRRANGVV